MVAARQSGECDPLTVVGDVRRVDVDQLRRGRIGGGAVDQDADGGVDLADKQSAWRGWPETAVAADAGLTAAARSMTGGRHLSRYEHERHRDRGTLFGAHRALDQRRQQNGRAEDGQSAAKKAGWGDAWQHVSAAGCTIEAAACGLAFSSVGSLHIGLARLVRMPQARTASLRLLPRAPAFDETSRLRLFSAGLAAPFRHDPAGPLDSSHP
jgi:hypothetical protein